MQVLVIAPAWLGDMVMSQVLLKRIKIKYPEAQIDVLAPPYLFDLIERMPEVRQTLLSPFQRGRLQLKTRYQLGRSLKKRGYNQAIILPNSWKSALVPFFAGIPLRTGWRGEQRFVLLNDLRVRRSPDYPSMAARFLALGDAPGTALPIQPYWPSLRRPTAEQAKQCLIRHQINPDQKIIAFCPGAAFGPAKCWPVRHFITLAQQQIKAGFTVLLLGAQTDHPVCDAIAKGADCLNLAGKTTLSEALDLLATATAVVSNDSGLLHVAAALQVPQIGLYGPTSPDFAPPLSDLGVALSTQPPCAPCRQRTCPLSHHQCLEGLSPATVSTTLASLLNNALP
jgi:heptosyltransferase-2